MKFVKYLERQCACLRCRDYRQAMRWARIERKTYKIPEPDIDVAATAESGDLPLFLRSDRN